MPWFLTAPTSIVRFRSRGWLHGVTKIVNALMTSPSWPSSVFFLLYDEGGGYDHVPPEPVIASSLGYNLCSPDAMGPQGPVAGIRLV